MTDSRQQRDDAEAVNAKKRARLMRMADQFLEQANKSSADKRKKKRGRRK